MLTIARLGGFLVITGILVGALFGFRGILGVLGVMPILSDTQGLGVLLLVLLGSGAAAIACSDSGPLAAHASSRIALGLVACGSFSIVLAPGGVQDVEPGSLGASQPLVILGIAGVLVPIGLTMLGVSLLRRNGLARQAGLAICVGGAVACVGLFSSSVLGYDASRAVLLIGALFVGAGVVGVGLLAIRDGHRA